MALATYRPPGAQVLLTAAGTVAQSMRRLGHMLSYFIEAIASIPVALRHYRHEFFRLLSDVTWGNGSLVAGGGTAGVAAVLGITAGALIGIEGYNLLDLLGLGPATGFVSSLVSTRELAPMMAALAFAMQAGCRFTAQLGAMRINEEIDALEVIGIRSVTYLASTRVMAGVIVVIPLYCIAVMMAFLAARTGTVLIYGQGSGVYDHYFNTFLNPTDVIWSFMQSVAMTIVIMLVHTYYGYTAKGGPAGVGEAVGRAVRTSMVVAAVEIVMISLAVYGQSGNFNLAG